MHRAQRRHRVRRIDAARHRPGIEQAGHRIFAEQEEAEVAVDEVEVALGLRRTDHRAVAPLGRRLRGEEDLHPSRSGAGQHRQGGELRLDQLFGHATEPRHLRVRREGRFLADHGHHAAHVAAGGADGVRHQTGSHVRRPARCVPPRRNDAAGEVPHLGPGHLRLGAQSREGKHQGHQGRYEKPFHLRGKRLKPGDVATTAALRRIVGQPFLDKPPPPCALAPQIP